MTHTGVRKTGLGCYQWTPSSLTTMSQTSSCNEIHDLDWSWHIITILNRKPFIDNQFWQRFNRGWSVADPHGFSASDDSGEIRGHAIFHLRDSGSTETDWWRISMGHYGLLWVTMGYYGSLWVTMGYYGFTMGLLWVYYLLWFYLFMGVTVGYYGFLWQV